MNEKFKKFNIIKEKDFVKLIFGCWTILTIMIINTFFNKNGLSFYVNNHMLLNICDFIDKNLILRYLFSFIMYYIIWIFIIHAILQEKLFKFKPIEISVVILIFWSVSIFLDGLFYAKIIDLLYFLFLAILCKKKWYRAIIGALLTFVFVWGCSYVKNIPIENLNFINLSTITATVFSIDIYLAAFVYYLETIYRKEYKCIKNYKVTQLKQRIIDCINNLKNTINNYFENNNNQISDKHHSILVLLITYVVIILLSIVFNRWLEISICIFFYYIFKGDTSDTYKPKTDFVLWLVLTLMFTFTIKLLFPISFSFVFILLTSLALCMFMRVAYHLSRPLKVKTKKDILIEYIGLANIKDEEYIEKMCSENGLPGKYSETIFLYLNNTIEETADILEIDVKTVRRRVEKFIEKQSI